MELPSATVLRYITIHRRRRRRRRTTFPFSSYQFVSFIRPAHTYGTPHMYVCVYNIHILYTGCHPRRWVGTNYYSETAIFYRVTVFFRRRIIYPIPIHAYENKMKNRSPRARDVPEK